MGLSIQTRAWRAGIVACSLACFGPVGSLRAEIAEPSIPIADVQPAEPFGLAVIPLASGGLHDKWLAARHRIDDDMVQLALCEGDRDGCVSEAALKFLDIVETARARDGRARLGEINRAINLAIRPVSDPVQHGQIDVWSSPLATLSRGGDCEDYAIAKFVALRRAGLAADDLRIVVLRDTLRGEDHAVAAARLDGRWLMLDNRRMAMVADADVRNLRPTFVIGLHGVMRYADDHLMADGTAENPAPAPLAGSVHASIDRTPEAVY